MRGTQVAFQDGHLYAVRDENGDGLISAEEVQKHKVCSPLPRFSLSFDS